MKCKECNRILSYEEKLLNAILADNAILNDALCGECEKREVAKIKAKKRS